MTLFHDATDSWKHDKWIIVKLDVLLLAVQIPPAYPTVQISKERP